MKQKRMLALFLALLMMFQLAPAAMAEGKAGTGPAITGIEVIRSAGIANVSLNAGTSDALLIVALYTSDFQLREIRTAEAGPGEGTFRLTFSQGFQDDPVRIKAMLVDPETYVPLCAALTEYTETQVITVDDFDPSLVINFDERKDENFAALAQGVVPLRAGTDFTRLETEDEVNFTVYGLSSAALGRLGRGVKAVLFDGDSSYPVSIDSVKTFSGGATLQGVQPDPEQEDGLNLADFFDYITFDREISELDPAAMEYAEGVRAAESPRARSGGGTDVTIPLLRGFQIATDIKTFHIEGTINMDINIHFIFRFSKDEQGRPHWFYDFASTSRVNLDLQLQAQLNNSMDIDEFDDDFQIFLGRLPIPVGVSGAQFVVSFSVPIFVQLDGGFQIKTGLTFNWRMTGYDTMEPEITQSAVGDDPDIKLEVGASLDVGFRLRAAFELFPLIYIEGVAQVGREFRGVLADDLGSSSADIWHQCQVCIDGTDTTYLKGWVEAGGKVLFVDYVLFHLENPKPVIIAKKNFYLSLSGGKWDFGYDRRCPNRINLADITLRNTRTGEPVSGTVSVTGKAQDSGYQGTIPVYNDDGKMYLPAGNYNISASAGGYSGGGIDYEVKAPGAANVFVTPPGEGTDPGAVEGIIGAKYRFRYAGGHLEVYEDIKDFDSNEILQEVQSGRMIYDTSLDDFRHGQLVSGRYYIAEYHEGASYNNYQSYYTLASQESSSRIDTCEIRSIDFQVDFPDNVVMYIPASPNLESITYGGEMLNHYESFQGCSNLAEINGMDKLVKIGDHAFQQTGLREAHLPNANQIYTEAFRDCKDLTRVTLGSGKIWKSAFQGCASLRQVDFGTVEVLEEYAFFNCVSLESVELPDTLTKAANCAFAGCTSLEQAQIPACDWYEGGIFKDCTNLRQVEWTSGNVSPGKLWNISYKMFSNCSSLEEIVIPDGVGNIDSEAFRGCLSLKKVTIPATVWKLGRDAFADCPSLREIYFEGTLGEWSILRGNSEYPVTYPVLVHCTDGDTVLTSRS